MKKKVKKIKVHLLPILIILLVIVFWGIYLNIFKLNYKKSITIDVSDKLPVIKDYIDKSDYNKLDNLDLKFNKIAKNKAGIFKIGDYSGYINYGIKKYKVALKIIDKENPKIENASDITLTVGDNVDLCSFVKVNDNSGEKVSLSIKGNYDLNKEGVYNLSYVAKDESGNKSEAKFTLTVTNNRGIQSSNTSSNHTGNKETKIKTIDGITYIDDVLIVNKTYSLPSTYNPGDITNNTKQAFNQMKADALSISLNIYISSGFRSYDRQSVLYNNYVAKDGKDAADTYSARAGFSEHQTGLAIDLNSIDDSFSKTAEGKWVSNNCYKYGFIIRYPKGKESITGFMYESWHLRYVGEALATKLYNNGSWITLEEYFGITSKYKD